MDTSSNPMAQTDAVEQRFAPAPSAVASSATPEQASASAPDAASANVFNVEGTDIIEGGNIAGLDVLEALK
ncbi:MAG: metal-sulfur cluster assembly factor, partial [Trueperella pyogenes]|nr:metal-sulfur cluster assembly factor [Trueperella pyogenes]